jgi:hypothetical protein
MEFSVTPLLSFYPVLPFYTLSGLQKSCRHPTVEGYLKESNFIFSDDTMQEIKIQNIRTAGIRIL